MSLSNIKNSLKKQNSKIHFASENWLISFRTLQQEPEILASLKVEYGNVLLYYYKYERSLKAFQEAQVKIIS